MKIIRWFAIGILATGLVSGAQAFTLTLTTDIPNPQQVGDVVTLIADVTGASPKANIVFKFEVAEPPGDFRLLQDFFKETSHRWVTLDEGIYVVQVIAIDRNTGEIQTASMPFARLPRAGKVPIVTPTAHPLVGLYSAPPCPTKGVALRVRYFPFVGEQPVKFTTYKDCVPGKTVNHYVAGVIAEQTYVLVGEVLINGQTFEGAPVQWDVPPMPLLADFNVALGAGPDASLSQSVLLGQSLGARDDGTYLFATNLAGVPIWSYGQSTTDIENATLTRPVRGGTFLTIATEVGGLPSQLLREIDLAGHVVRETNRDAINDDLRAMGQDEMGGFHHEALRLSNGHTLALASVERILTNVQEPGPVNVYGEMVLDLDENFDVAWSWNSFDYLDASNAAILNEHCARLQPGCPYIFLTETARDWLHMNSIGYSPDDGNIILSARHQDAVYKIDYADGTGSGNVVWTLGANGDFDLINFPLPVMPWFSHQHDVHYAGAELLVYDNGNTRRAFLGDQENSRGQSYVLDEVNMTAELVFSVDLGQYSAAVGSAQKLVNGNYHFHSGFLGTFAEPAFAAIEIAPNRAPQFIELGAARAYRSFRMTSLYEEGVSIGQIPTLRDLPKRR